MSMKLFHDYNDGAFQLALSLLAVIQNREGVRERELRELAEELSPFPDLFPESLSLLQRCHLIEGKGDAYVSTASAPISIPLRGVEETIRKEICSSAVAALFLGEREAQTPSPFRFIRRQNEEDKEKELETFSHPVFRTLLRGILEHRRVRHTYRTNADPTERQSEAIPFRLEYQIFDGRWWVILYRPEENRTVKAKLGNILWAELGEPHSVPVEVMERAVLSMLEPERVVLRVKKEKNALERCFLCFEGMEGLSGRILREDVYEVSFSFFAFDRNDILKKLLYLGECVTLREPESLKRELVETLRRALERQG